MDKIKVSIKEPQIRSLKSSLIFYQHKKSKIMLFVLLQNPN